MTASGRTVPFCGPRLVLLGEPTAVGTLHADRLSQWLGVTLVAADPTSPRGAHRSIDDVIRRITEPAVARSGFLLHGLPATVAQAVAVCEAVGGPFDLAVELTHAIDDLHTQDERYLRAWLDGMGVLTQVDATRPSQVVWGALLDALDPVLWGTGQRVG